MLRVDCGWNKCNYVREIELIVGCFYDIVSKIDGRIKKWKHP